MLKFWNRMIRMAGEFSCGGGRSTINRETHRNPLRQNRLLKDFRTRVDVEPTMFDRATKGNPAMAVKKRAIRKKKAAPKRKSGTKRKVSKKKVAKKKAPARKKAMVKKKAARKPAAKRKTAKKKAASKRKTATQSKARRKK